ncbi:MAG: Crp/Fnr family transcriptional regulator [Bacteroidales bacterium]|nr:Crp/Fnr family transcriptional regulator [Bacteroidales bacterium]
MIKEKKNTTPPTCVVSTPHINIFEYLTKEEAELLNINQRNVKFKKGEILAKQGSFASHVIFLRSGLAKVYLEGDQKDLILKIVTNNHFVSLSSVFDGNDSFIYSVSTYVDSEATLFNIDAFKQVLRSNSKFSAQIINLLNANTAQVYGRFYCLTRKQSHGRVADIIMCLSENIFESHSFNLNLSRNDLADLTGLSSESVTRIFKEFRDSNIIEINNKDINILDYQRLKDISTYG